MSTDVTQLNQQFAIPDQLQFKTGAGDLPVAEITTQQATATVALHGGHVLTYQPRDQAPVLWLSDFSRYEVGQAIRGGIPVVWPWFGPHPTDPTKPAHGLARSRMWQVAGSKILANGATQLRLKLTNDEDTIALWPHPFGLEVEITVGAALEVALIARNQANQPVTCGAALHTYFNISDIGEIKVKGLDGCTYLDKVDGDRRKVQQGPVRFSGETDRVYLETTGDCLIVDPDLGRQIRVAKHGSRSTVVWNPWIDKAQRMADFGDEEYATMVCVETCNAADDVVLIPPGGTHQLVAIISVESWGAVDG